jgi:small GTP-binding protein
MGDFKVHLHKNQSNSPGEPFQVRRNWDMATFKKKAGARMSMKVKRVFLPTGSEVTGCDEMSANEDLYLSSGEDFYKNSSSNGTGKAQETFYVSVLGTGGVGKSALTLRFVRDFFVQDWDPTIEDAYRKPVDVDDETCLLDILDTAGQDDFESLRPSWMIGKDGYVFVFSLDQPQSLDELHPFFELHQQLNEGRKVPIVLVANKKDLANLDTERQAKAREEGMKRAHELNASYIETSALTGENVQETFETFVRQVRAIRRGGPKPTRNKRCSLM